MANAVIENTPFTSTEHILDMKIQASDNKCKQRAAIASVGGKKLPFVEINR